jgi:polyisoprenoid-binding protein YceI
METEILKMKRKQLPLFTPIFILLSSIGLSNTTFALNLSQVDIAKSKVSFLSKQMNVPVEGKFDKFNAKLNLDTDKVETAKASIQIELASIDTGSKEGNEEVYGKKWFDTKQFPVAQFDLKKARKLGEGKIELIGDLSIKGKTKPLTTIAHLKILGNQASIDGSFIFKRLDYFIGEGVWGDVDVVANEVQIRYQLLLK